MVWATKRRNESSTLRPTEPNQNDAAADHGPRRHEAGDRFWIGVGGLLLTRLVSCNPQEAFVPEVRNRFRSVPFRALNLSSPPCPQYW